MSAAGDGRLPRVFHIHLGDKGGAENFFVRLVQAFDKAGVSQMALTRKDRVWHPEIEPHLELLTSDFSSSHIKRYLGRRRIRAKVTAFGADIVMAWMAPAARWAPNDLAGTVPIVRLGDFPDKMEPLWNCRHIVGNTPEIIRQCVAQGWPEERGHVVSNFVDPSNAKAMTRAELGVADDSYLVVGLGRFVERKGFRYLLEAVAKAPDTSLILLGDGPLKGEFEEFISEHGLQDRVKLLGWMNEPQQAVLAADCLCCPSLSEPLGNVVLEGWACGVPVIAARAEGPSWLIEDGENGLLFDKSDTASLVEALHRVRQSGAAEKLAAKGRETLHRSYSRQAIVSQYLDLFERISR
ncbi:glycosyltransferase [Rhizobiaceae bacterium]|nr:glycosyltransferase [Rhizobiaceae bacterium]